MAILRDVEVTISAKGSTLPEYDDDAEELGPSNTVTKYIEALTGADFQIDYRIKPTFQMISTGIAIRIYIDGEYMDSHVLRQNQQLTNLSREHYGNTFKGARRLQSQSWTFQAFNFAEIKTSEDNVAVSDSDLKDLVSKLGVIRTDVHQVKVKDEQAVSAVFAKPRVLKALPEKALKGQALSHQASLGPLQQTSSQQVADVEYIEGHRPFAVFNFKYRSRMSLQGILVIPRTPSPVPLERRPLDELTREEALELLRRRSIQVKPEVTPAVNLKREHDDLDPERNEDEEYVALLASARAQKAARIHESIDVIDLLDD